MTTPKKSLGTETKQPHYDFELAKVCEWLKKNNLRAHVKLSGAVYVEDKLTGKWFKL
jgi:hypothetical protein